MDVMKTIEQRVADLERSVQWWRGLTLTLTMLFIGLTVITTLIGRRALRSTVTARKGEFHTIRAKQIDITDDKQAPVVRIQSGFGGGVINVTSSTADDHDLLLMANPRGTTVQLSHQAQPRRFGLFSMIDRLPVVQMYEESPAPGRPRNFHQFPAYKTE